jgi:hypothetical protein
MDRRKFIKLAGGGVLLAAVASSVGVFASGPITGVPDSAVAAWKGPAADTELRRSVLSYAILAPNPHNRQPWIADLRTPGEILLSLDPERLLPASDPHGRQIMMGAGAFLELLVMAAADRGHRTEVILFPAGELGETPSARPFARIKLVADPNVARDPLFKAVLDRRTDRRVYDLARPIAGADLEKLRAAASARPVAFGVVTEPARVDLIRAIAREAWRIELTTEGPMMETMRVIRIGSSEIDQHRDGIALTDPMVFILAKTGLLDRSRMPAADSPGIVRQIKDFTAATASTPAYLWIVTEGNTRAQQIEAGRAYARINLAGTGLGLAMHPNEQSLQEYPEMTNQYQAIHALLDAPTPRFTVQMLARLGYRPSGVAQVDPAPRRGVDAQIRA